MTKKYPHDFTESELMEGWLNPHKCSGDREGKSIIQFILLYTL